MRSTIPKALALLLILAAVAACTPLEPSSEKPEALKLRLSEDMLRGLFPGNMDAMSQRIGPSILLMRRDGTFTYRLFGAKFDDTGKWRLQAGQLCLQYEFIGSGVEQCHWVYQINPGRYLMRSQDGSEEVTFTVWSGSGEAAPTGK
jgi:hypothetical protein